MISSPNQPTYCLFCQRWFFNSFLLKDKKRDKMVQNWAHFSGNSMISILLNSILIELKVKNFSPPKLYWQTVTLLTCSRRGFIAQSVKHRTGIAEVMGLNPIEASYLFQGFFLCNCLSCFTTAKITFTSIIYPKFIYMDLYHMHIISSSRLL